ncbi:PREDICTED: uncharacterized protein LOC109580795 [Amphimedon queenslandica]|uniref:CARD domain-containing protein n=1 Tax=Amphimedon queenslandica TaxID=400682 RepID=A0A1X7V9W9_AMPQE|nr:PREDICTED: uncharacterized protein LOC109580795 [Amphimedon queenslandica]|eukprot:XP_019849890.1 PREDICTED: uncharacterized protein LOC109580795 [Amphimedon queenslandica]
MENEVSKVFRRHMLELISAIGPSILDVTTVLQSKGFVTLETKDKIQTVLGTSDQEKATTLVNALVAQLRGKEHHQAKEDLIEICCVLSQNNCKLWNLCERTILGELHVDPATHPICVKYRTESVHECIDDVSKEMRTSVKSVTDSLEDIMKYIELNKEVKFLKEAKSFYEDFITFNQTVATIFEKVEDLLQNSRADRKVDFLRQLSSKCLVLHDKYSETCDSVSKSAKLVAHECEKRAIKSEQDLGSVGPNAISLFVGNLFSMMDLPTTSDKDQEFKSLMSGIVNVSERASKLQGDGKRYRQFQEYFEKIHQILGHLQEPMKSLIEKVRCLLKHLESSKILITKAMPEVPDPSAEDIKDKISQMTSTLMSYIHCIDLD